MLTCVMLFTVTVAESNTRNWAKAYEIVFQLYCVLYHRIQLVSRGHALMLVRTAVQYMYINNCVGDENHVLF